MSSYNFNIEILEKAFPKWNSSREFLPKLSLTEEEAALDLVYHIVDSKLVQLVGMNMAIISNKLNTESDGIEKVMRSSSASNFIIFLSSDSPELTSIFSKEQRSVICTWFLSFKKTGEELFFYVEDGFELWSQQI